MTVKDQNQNPAKPTPVSAANQARAANTQRPKSVQQWYVLDHIAFNLLFNMFFFKGLWLMFKNG